MKDIDVVFPHNDNKISWSTRHSKFLPVWLFIYSSLWSIDYSPCHKKWSKKLEKIWIVKCRALHGAFSSFSIMSTRCRLPLEFTSRKRKVPQSSTWNRWISVFSPLIDQLGPNELSFFMQRQQNFQSMQLLDPNKVSSISTAPSRTVLPSDCKIGRTEHSSSISWMYSWVFRGLELRVDNDFHIAFLCSFSAMEANSLYTNPAASQTIWSKICTAILDPSRNM